MCIVCCVTLRLCNSPGAEQHSVVLSNVHVGKGQGLQYRIGQEGSRDMRVSTGMQHTGPCRGLLLGVATGWRVTSSGVYLHSFHHPGNR